MSYYCLRVYVLLCTSTTRFLYLSVTCTMLFGLFLLKQCLAFRIDINMHRDWKKYIMIVLFTSKSLIRLSAWRIWLSFTHHSVVMGVIFRCIPIFYWDWTFWPRVTNISSFSLRTILFRRDIELNSWMNRIHFH